MTEKQKTILVVEDEKITAIDIRERLVDLGYTVPVDLSTGEEAVEAAGRLKPDLVLMDIVLKGEMDGVQAAEKIGSLYHIPVVFLTAFSDDETLQRAKQTEPFGYILKPFDERELRTTIEMALYRHSMQEALRLSEEKFSKAFRTSPDAININRLRDGLFLEVNNQFTVLTGYAREEVIGKSSLEIEMWVDPADRARLMEGLRRSGEVSGMEPRFRMKDGRILTALMSAAVIELNREPVILSITRDISARLQAEQALRESELRYKEFFEQDLAGYFVSTPEGTILDCNSAYANLFGFSSVEEAKGSNATRLYANPEDRKDLHDLLRRQKKLEDFELEARRIDGQPIFLKENIIGRFNEQGELTQIRGYIMNNTDRKLLEQQLFHAQKMESIGTLASGIAHDFNNVLNNILGFSHQLKKHVADPAKVMKYSDSIEKSASRGAGLAKQLMSFVRKKKRENTVINVEEIIDEVIDLTAETFPKTITVRKNIGSFLMHVLGDRGELYQAILNLCLNARDAVIERGDFSAEQVIVISAASRKVGEPLTSGLPGEGQMSQPYSVEVSVKDSGVGIPDAILDKIFDPFFTTKERGKGTGLGLSVVYNIVKNHNGSVNVESEPGKGTTFHILLPAVETEVPLNGIVEFGSLRATQNQLILLVDDEELMQDLGKELLEEAGYRVLIAANGEQAVDIYRSSWRHIALVILDLLMPDMNGGQVYAQMKLINPALKTFFCTGYAEDELIASLLERNHLQALDKPFKPSKLLRMIKETLGETVA